MQTIYAVEFYRGVGSWLSYEFVLMDDETDDTQVVLDTLIDHLKEEGDSAVMTLEEVEENGIAEDYYVIGGNEGLAFVHNTALDISKATYSQLTSNIPKLSSRGTEHLIAPYLWFKKGASINDVVKGIKLYCAKQNWAILADVPTCLDHEDGTTYIANDVTLNGKVRPITFEEGTDVEHIWHWLESEFEVSVGEDLMSLEDEPIW